MPSDPVYLTLPSKKGSRLRQRFRDKGTVLWLYLGTDCSKRDNMAYFLGEDFKEINIARLHSKVSEDIRKEHVLWCDELNRNHIGNPEWWFGTVSSRNIYESRIFQYSCYLEIFKLLMSVKEDTPQLVVVESAPLLHVIKRWGNDNGINIETLFGGSSAMFNIIGCTYPFFRWLKFVMSLFIRWFYAKLTKIYAQKTDLNGKECLLLCTHLHHNSFTNGEFNDRYFPFLHNYLAQKGIDVVIYPITNGIRNGLFSVFFNMRRSAADFIVQEDYLTLSDYIYAAAYPFRVKRRFEVPRFKGADITGIVMEEQILKGSVSGLNAALAYRLFLRLKGSLSINPSKILMWYENQYIDRAIILGARNSFKGINIVGAQLYILAPNYLMLYPSRSEVDAGIIPDILIEPSRRQCKLVKRFTSAISCRSAAALRYHHLFKDVGGSFSEEKDNTILALLPLNMEESMELLGVLKETAGMLEPDKRIVIKIHPDYKTDIFLKKVGQGGVWHSRFEVAKGNISDVLGFASVIVSVNSSSMVEGLVRGIPVVSFSRQNGLSQYLFSGVDTEMVTECFCTEEVVHAVKRYLSTRKKMHKSWLAEGKRIRDIFFEAVRDDTLAPFLEGVRGNK